MPEEVAFSASQRQIIVSPEYTAALSGRGRVAVFSNSMRSMIGNFENVQSICWVELEFMESPVLAMLSDGKISLNSSSGSIPQGGSFDETKKISPFVVTRLNENFLKICEFETGDRAVSLIPFGSGSLLALDDRGQLEKVLFFPDGVYKGKCVSAEKCERFSWTGLFLAGASVDEVHVWTSGLEHVRVMKFASANVCALGFSKVGVISGEKLTVVDCDGDRKSEILLVRKVPFVALVENEVVYPPEKATLGFDSPFLPLFVDEKSVYTVECNEYIERVLSVFPIGIAVTVLEGKYGVDRARVVIAEHAVRTINVGLVASFLDSQGTEPCLKFVRELKRIIFDQNDVGFARAIFPKVASFCVEKIAGSHCADEFSELLTAFKDFVCPVQSCTVTSREEDPCNFEKIGETDVREFVQKCLRKNDITKGIHVLQNSFPDYQPFILFKTLVLQDAWCLVCENKIGNAETVIKEFGDDPMEVFHEMWRQTTRRMTREALSKRLSGKLSREDEENAEVLRKLIGKREKDGRTESWKPTAPLDNVVREQHPMMFESIYHVPEEPEPSNGYFVGNIDVIEKSREKMRDREMEKLWKLHSDVSMLEELKSEFRAHLEKGSAERFLNKYYTQMNICERELLANMLCEHGKFVQFECDRPELLVARICNIKKLFDVHWWEQHKALFEEFVRVFAKFCADRFLYVPFDLFINAHSELLKGVQLDHHDIGQPLRFIWDLWKRCNISDAALSWTQYKAKSDSQDFTELWKSLDDKSMAPLASYIWNQDREKFKPDSAETIMLSQRFLKEYPFLASLVRGKLPPTGTRPAVESKWRSPMWTSKYDLELHDMIQERFAQYDFSPIFTEYSGFKGDQPDFPNFERSDIIKEPTAEPYLLYLKCKVPFSTFQLALDNGVDEEEFKALSLSCLKEALVDRKIRMSVLSFIELVDMKFGSSMATDYKLCLAIYDKLFSADNDTLIYKLSVIFTRKDKDAAQTLEKKLMPDSRDLYLICALLRVRCGLPLDYSPITRFATSGEWHDLLSFIDQAAELGAHYPIREVVKIVQERMPESNLKAHLLFHLSQSLPTEAGPTSAETPPALVAFRADTGGNPAITLLQEALNRKDQVYGFLATAVDGADLALCAYVIMRTIGDMEDDFDVAMYSDSEASRHMPELFLETLVSVLYQKKSLELMKALELFGKESIVVQLIFFYRAIELFAFKRAESIITDLKALIKDKMEIRDPLLGEVQVSDLLKVLFGMIESLAKECAEKSQIHVFRFLSLLSDPFIPPTLKDRVKLCQVISGYEGFKRAIVCSNLLGDTHQIVSDLVMNHSLALGQAAADCFAIPSDVATKEWLAFKYSMASSPAQVLEIHKEVADSVKTSDAMFFVCIFASLLPYAQPTFLMPILEYAKTIAMDGSPFSKKLSALLLHLKLCKQNNIHANQVTGALPSLTDIFEVLFPGTSAPATVPAALPKITSNVVFGLDAIQNFFETSVDVVIDMCLEQKEVGNAYLICEWRNEDPKNIAILEAVHLALVGETLTTEQEDILSPFGDRSNMQELLDSIAKNVGWRFVLLSLHHRASVLLGVPTTNLLQRKTADFIESELSVTMDQWDLIRELIQASQMSANEVAAKLAESFVDHVKKVIAMGVPARSNQLAIDNYGEQYLEFTKLCNCPNAVGDRLFDIVRKNRQDLSLAVAVNIILHASLCTSDIDECADLCDTLLDTLTNEDQLDLVMELVCIFPEPALLPRYFQYLIAQQKLDELPASKLNEKVGRVIMNCARHVHPFEPQNYFDLTLKYNLRRDHAELQMQCGLRLLVGNPDNLKLHDASRHFLLALAYFLQEKCYSLAMECLKKLSLISLQTEMTEPEILHLESQEVLQLMCQKDFPFALTLAVAYDMDTEANWAEAIYEQTVVGTGDEFLTTFQFFRPITSELCDGVVRKYQAGKPDDEQRNRMKMFINNIPNLVERYRIAKSLEFTDQIESMKQLYPVVCEWCDRACIGQR